MNKELLINKIGGSEAFTIHKRNKPIPKKDEVLIKFNYVSLNRADLLQSNGKYGENKVFPAHCGFEGTGIIEQIGNDNVDEANDNNSSSYSKLLKVGDNVSIVCNFPISDYGTYKEYGLFPIRSVVKRNEKVDEKVESAAWVAYLTGYFALVEYGKIKKDDWVVITAASSSTGLAAISIAKFYGAKVIATSRGDSKKQQLLDFGADYFISTDKEDYVECVKQITNGQGSTIVYDPIVGSNFEKFVKGSSMKGTIIIYGLMDLQPTIIPVGIAMGKALNIKCFALFEYLTQPELFQKGLLFINENLHNFKSLVGKEFNSIDKLPEAIKYLESADLFGKIVVKIN